MEGADGDELCHLACLNLVKDPMSGLDAEHRQIGDSVQDKLLEGGLVGRVLKDGRMYHPYSTRENNLPFENGKDRERH